jgi:hypothetical protein
LTSRKITEHPSSSFFYYCSFYLATPSSGGQYATKLAGDNVPIEK